jgi:hypothetical protein
VPEDPLGVGGSPVEDPGTGTEVPPVGLAKPCTSAADCAGTEATYCDTFVTMGCLVEGCNLEVDDCYTGYECCDLSAFGIPLPLCIEEGQCQS